MCPCLYHAFPVPGPLLLTSAKSQSRGRTSVFLSELGERGFHCCRFFLIWIVQTTYIKAIFSLPSFLGCNDPSGIKIILLKCFTVLGKQGWFTLLSLTTLFISMKIWVITQFIEHVLWTKHKFVIHSSYIILPLSIQLHNGEIESPGDRTNDWSFQDHSIGYASWTHGLSPRYLANLLSCTMRWNRCVVHSPTCPLSLHLTDEQDKWVGSSETQGRDKQINCY